MIEIKSEKIEEFSQIPACFFVILSLNNFSELFVFNLPEHMNWKKIKDLI